MKIAYLFCGHSRTWLQCYESFFENIYDVANGDIFIHTWDRVNSMSGSWWNGWGDVVPENIKEISGQKPDIESIKKIFNPQSLIVDNDPSWIISETAEQTIGKVAKFNVRHILKSLKQTFDIAKQYDNYDRIFCTRLDIKYLSKLDKAELEDPRIFFSKTYHTSENVTQDIFFHGGVSVVQKRIDLCDCIDQYWYSQNINEDYEGVLNKYIKDKNISYTESSLKFCIPRIDNTVSNYDERT